MKWRVLLLRVEVVHVLPIIDSGGGYVGDDDDDGDDDEDAAALHMRARQESEHRLNMKGPASGEHLIMITSISMMLLDMLDRTSSSRLL